MPQVYEIFNFFLNFFYKREPTSYGILGVHTWFLERIVLTFNLSRLLSQVMTMSYFPHIKTVHTSKKFHGQVYMPMANWLLMIGTVIVTAVYSDVSNLLN